MYADVLIEYGVKSLDKTFSYIIQFYENRRWIDKRRTIIGHVQRFKQIQT